MRITIVTPARAGTTHGNRVTAIRWAGMLEQLGHRVSLRQTFDDQPADLLIALHARRSYASIKRFHRQFPESPIVHIEYANGLIRLFGKTRIDDATRLYQKAAAAMPADAMEHLDMELAKSELE